MKTLTINTMLGLFFPPRPIPLPPSLTLSEIALTNDGEKGYKYKQLPLRKRSIRAVDK